MQSEEWHGILTPEGGERCGKQKEIDCQSCKKSRRKGTPTGCKQHHLLRYLSAQSPRRTKALQEHQVMATRIAECIAQNLLASSVIEEGDKELYSYGFFLLITRFFFFVITIIAGFLAFIPGQSILFYMVFVSLRTYAGGVHTRSENTCTILTTLALIVSVFGIKVMGLASSNLIAVYMLVIGSLCILLFSPLDTKEKPLENRERKYYRTISCALTLTFIVISVASQLLSIFVLCYPISCGICLEGILLLVGKIRTTMDPALYKH